MKLKDNRGNIYEVQKENFDVKKIGKWHLLNGKKFSFYREKGKLYLFYEGSLYIIEVYHKTTNEHRNVENTAPMTGRIVSIKVSEGEFVKKDQPLLVMEAMKMEITINAYKDGKVSKIYVSEGQLVHQGEKLFEID